MRIITLNANGLRAATRKGLFPWLLEQSADAICIQETKAQEHQIPAEAALPGYRAYFVDALKKGYSGVAIYTKEAPTAVQRGLGIEDIDAEGRYLQIDFGKLSIASVYVPSGTSGAARQAVKYRFLERFLPRLAAMRHDGRSYIVCGDYNIAHSALDVFDAASCAGVTGFLPPERAWLDTLVDGVGWVDAMRVVDPAPQRFTWWSARPGAFERNLGWRIDYHMVTPDLRDRIRQASIYRDRRFSDHAPVTIDYSI